MRFYEIWGEEKEGLSRKGSPARDGLDGLDRLARRGERRFGLSVIR